MSKLIRSIKEEIFVYEVFCNNFDFTQYGIKVYNQNYATENVEIDNISNDKFFVDYILRILADNQVSPIHCQEIVEEILSEN